jgi:hypothetical protein
MPKRQDTQNSSQEGSSKRAKTSQTGSNSSMRQNLKELLQATTEVMVELDTIDDSTEDVLFLSRNQDQIKLIMKAYPQDIDARITEFQENLSALKAKYKI